MSVPYDNRNAPRTPLSRGTDIDAAHSYAKPVEPLTGPIDTKTIPRPGQDLPHDTKQEIFRVPDGTPPSAWYRWRTGTFQRQNALQNLDIMPVPISGPSTEVVRPVMQTQLIPSPRWTARFAPPVYRYTREFAQRFNTFGNGAHTSMATYVPIRKVKSRPMNRNNITPRNVPQPLDDQVTNTANRTQYGTVFSSGSYSWR